MTVDIILSMVIIRMCDAACMPVVEARCSHIGDVLKEATFADEDNTYITNPSLWGSYRFKLFN